MTNADKGKYVLIAEDEEFLSKVYTTTLKKAGLDVKVVRDGQQLLNEVRARLPDLIILDLIMPKMDGFEALREIKGDPKLKDIKVIILSNLEQNKDVREITSLGVTEYVVKTNVSIHEMIDKIKVALQ